MIQELPRVAFWLVPAEPERSRLQRRIDRLAERFSGPPFLPHLTLYTCQRTASGRELAVLAGLARQSRPVVLQATTLESTELLTQTLVVRFVADEALLVMQRLLHEGVPEPSAYQLTPHLSLLYQFLPQPARQSLVDALDVPCAALRFDELRAVAIPERVAQPEQVLGWQTLLTCRLE